MKLAVTQMMVMVKVVELGATILAKYNMMSNGARLNSQLAVKKLMKKIFMKKRYGFPLFKKVNPTSSHFSSIG